VSTIKLILRINNNVQEIMYKKDVLEQYSEDVIIQNVDYN